MWNIMKAQNYQTKNDNLTVYILLFGILFPFIILLIEVDFDVSTLTGSMTMAQVAEMFPFVLAIITLGLTTRICGWDQADKTMNYEILSGHSRGEVYFSRVIVSLLWSGISSMIIIILPVLVFSLINGWGVSMKLGDIVVRYLLVIFPILRLICEFILLTFLLQNCYKAMLIGWVLFYVAVLGSMVYQDLTDKVMTVQFAVTNMMQLLNFSNFRPEYINGQDVPIYETAVSQSMVAGTLVVSILIGTLCLAAGYAIYRKQDIH